MVVSTHLAEYQNYHAGDFTEVDGRRASADIGGIGHRLSRRRRSADRPPSIRGLATARRRWLVAAIGLGAGAGICVESVGATVINVAALIILRRFEDKDDRARRRLLLTLTEAARSTDALVAKLAKLDLLPTVEGWNKDTTVRQLTLAVRLPRRDGEATLVAALEKAEPGIARMDGNSSRPSARVGDRS